MPAPSGRFVAAGKRHDFAIEARSKQGGEAVRKQRQQSSDEVKRGVRISAGVIYYFAGLQCAKLDRLLP